MAKELYVGKILTNEMITVGKQLVQRLEATVPISASFWFYISEAESWHLFIVSPRVLTDGPKKSLILLSKRLMPITVTNTHCHSLIYR